MPGSSAVWSPFPWSQGCAQARTRSGECESALLRSAGRWAERRLRADLTQHILRAPGCGQQGTSDGFFFFWKSPIQVFQIPSQSKTIEFFPVTVISHTYGFLICIIFCSSSIPESYPDLFLSPWDSPALCISLLTKLERYLMNFFLLLC